MTALRFQVLAPGRSEPRHLRAMVSTFVESGSRRGAHHDNVKPFTVQPPVQLPDGFAVLVSTLDDRAQQELSRSCSRADGQQLQLGHMTVGFDDQPTEPVEAATYQQLLDQAVDHPTVPLQLRSPMVFRSGRRDQTPFPLPRQVFGHYRTRWNRFAPPELHCDLAFDDLGLQVQSMEGRTERYADAHQRNGRRIDLEFVGFVGHVEFRVTGRGATPSARRWLHALASLGAYCGTGANTTIGMGATRYLGDRAAAGNGGRTAVEDTTARQR